MPRAPRRQSDEARRGAYKPHVDFSRSRRRREDGLLALRRLNRDTRLFKRRRDEPAPAVPVFDLTPTPVEAAPFAGITRPAFTPSSPPDVAAPRDAAESEVCALPRVRSPPPPPGQQLTTTSSCSSRLTTTRGVRSRSWPSALGASGVHLRTGGVGGQSRRRGWRAVVGGVDYGQTVVGGVDFRRAEVGAGAVYIESLIVSSDMYFYNLNVGQMDVDLVLFMYTRNTIHC
jgi:hypothetical protein